MLSEGMGIRRREMQSIRPFDAGQNTYARSQPNPTMDLTDLTRAAATRTMYSAMQHDGMPIPYDTRSEAACWGEILQQLWRRARRSRRTMACRVHWGLGSV